MSLFQAIVFTVSAFVVVSDDCSPPSREVVCECSAASIHCSGSATNLSEFQLPNVSLMETVHLEISDLKLDFDFANTSIRNLTLGYDIRNLPPDFFRGSTSLLSLNLRNNGVANLSDPLFSTLSNLRELFLDENLLQELSPGAFATLPALDYLSVAKNRLQEIDGRVFQSLSNLRTLVLSHNNFSSVERVVELSSESLTKLEMTHCSMEGVLERDTFSGLPALEHLDMSHNRISEIHQMSALKNLQFLSLGSNSIQKLQDRAFSEVRNLTSLDLKENEISVVKITSFNHLHNLKYLDLSGNKLTAILCEYTTDLHSLERINLQNNKIKTFSQGAFFYSPYLQVLDLAGNTLECSCPLTDTALHLIANSTMKREDLELVSCVIPVTLASESVIKYESSKCVPEEPCKKVGEDPEDYEDDYTDESTTAGETSTVTSTAVTPTAESATTAKSTEPQTITTTTPLTTESSSERTTEFLMSTTSISSTVPQSTENTNLTSAKETNIVTMSTSSDTSISDVPKQSTTNIFATSGASGCSSLSLNGLQSSVDSEFFVLSNFSYDGSIFCLKWALVGSLTNVKRCIIKYSHEGGTGYTITHLACPSAANEILTWSYDKKIFKFCISVVVHKATSHQTKFCNYTSDRVLTTTPNGRESLETTIMKTFSKTEKSSAETTVFRIDSKLETIPPHFDIIALNVYFNNSNLAFATWAVNTEAPPNLCNMTLKATTQYLDYEEGVFPCRNSSHRLRYVKETDIFKICLSSQHGIDGPLTECTLSVSPALASKSDDKDSVSGSMIPLICLLVLLVLIVLFIIFKNLFKKKTDTNKYDVRAEEVKYQQRVKIRPPSANEQSMRFSYIVRESADNV